MKLVKKFITNQSGATAIEYSLMASVIASTVVAAGATLKADFGTAFSNLGAKIKSPPK